VNVLVLTSNADRASFRQRVEIYLDILRASGISCKVVKLPSGLLARQRLFKRSAEFDGVFLHRKTLNFLDAIWLRRYARRIIYDFDDAIMYSDKHPDVPSRKRQKSFQRTVKLADLVITNGSYLANHVRKFNRNVHVLGDSFNVRDYEQDISPPDDGKIRLVWIGSKSTLKYLAEIKPALEEIGSRFDNAVLRIICDDFFDLQNMPVEKCLWSLEKQAVDLAQSHIGLAPLPDNEFTLGKNCFKILQYAAAGLAVIASPVGANTDYIRDGINGFLAGDCSEWVEKMSRLLSDSQLRKRMSQAGKTEVQQFDLKTLGKQFVNLIKESLQNAKT
jgi:glycosyltransferase involved in cell wall biosynthesis